MDTLDLYRAALRGIPQDCPWVEMESRGVQAAMADGFVPVELKSLTVGAILVHPTRVYDLFGSDSPLHRLLDDKSHVDSPVAAEGEIGSLWGAKIIALAEVPGRRVVLISKERDREGFPRGFAKIYLPPLE